MFKKGVNMPCKQIVENAPMHDTTRRLYEAALVLSRGVATKPSEVAAFYGVTQQVLKNWENRGISQQGMISICELRPAIQLAWLSRGDGPAPHTTPSAQPQPPQAKAIEEPAGAPTLAQALEVLLVAIAESPHRAELRQLLPMLVDTNAPAYRQRLGELLAPGGPANPTKPAIQAQTHDFAGKPPQIHNKETAGKAPAIHRAGNFIKP